MSSVDIEDVLSSIRRLVSEDLRPGPRSVSAPVVQQMTTVPNVETQTSDDKLLLTPALRVAAQPDPTPQRAVLPRLHLGAEPVSHAVVSTLERAVEAQSSEWESEVGDPPLLVNDMEWSENGWVVPNPVKPTAQVVNFVTATPGAAPSWAQIDPEIADAESTKLEPIAEPDSVWADQAEAEAVAELNAANQTAETASPDLRLDEQVLRELVRELILQELQGTLGERITRNVRKLVRAEIARAISVHGVE